jgi:hypothetical protein
MRNAKRHTPNAADDDNPVWTEDDFKRSLRAAEVLPALIADKTANALPSGRHEPTPTATPRAGN